MSSIEETKLKNFVRKNKALPPPAPNDEFSLILRKLESVKNNSASGLKAAGHQKTRLSFWKVAPMAAAAAAILFLTLFSPNPTRHYSGNGIDFLFHDELPSLQVGDGLLSLASNSEARSKSK